MHYHVACSRLVSPGHFFLSLFIFLFVKSFFFFECLNAYGSMSYDSELLLPEPELQIESHRLPDRLYRGLVDGVVQTYRAKNSAFSCL